MKKLIKNSLILLVLIVGTGFAQVPGDKNVAGLAARYDLNVRILPESHRLEGNGTLLIPPAQTKRETIELGLEKTLDDLQIEVLQPTISKGIAKVDKKEDSSGNPTWSVRPARPFPASEQILLRFSYSGGAPNISGLFYVGSEASFGAAAWYPSLSNVRGKGMLRFTVPAGETVVATGSRLSQPPEEAQGRFQFEVDFPAFFSFAAGKYTVVKRGGPVPVSAYLLRPRQNIEAHLDTCSTIITALEREFGAYPYGSSGFPLIELPSKVGGGLNGIALDGGFLVNGKFLDQKPNFRVYSHEISHEWWAHLISREGAIGTDGDYMLDEAMAEFGFLLAAEAIEGPDAAERYRRIGYPGFEEDHYSGLGYFKLTAAGLDYHLGELPDGNLSSKLSRSKAPRVWYMLAQTIGREKFRQIIHNITRRFAFQSVTWKQFLQAIEEGAGTDLKWFYTQWFERTGAPDWTLTWKQEGNNLLGVITQPAPYYRAKLEIQAEGNYNERKLIKVEVRGAQSEFIMPVKFRVREVILDPRFLMLHWTPEYRTEAMALAGYTRGRYKLGEDRQAEAEAEFKATLEQVPVPDLYSARFLAENALSSILFSQKKWKEAKSHLEAALASPTRRADILPSTYVRLARIARELGDKDLLCRSVDAAISADATLENRSGAGEAARVLCVNP